MTPKALATLDWMTSARIIATFGAGRLEKEFEILGVDFHQSGAVCEESLAAMIQSWTD